MKRKTVFAIGALLALVVLATFGCRKPVESKPKKAKPSAALPASLFLAAEPSGATSIAAAKENAKEGDEVVVKAIVGGRLDVFVENRAVMTVIDPSVNNPCTADDDHCQFPWDYCCTPMEQRTPHMASVQILGPDARPLPIDLNTVDQVKPLNTVVIKGTVGARTDPTSLVINATGIFVAAQQG